MKIDWIKLLKYATIVPALVEDIQQKREIDSYIKTAERTLAEKSSPDYNCVLETLRNDYPAKGIFSHSAKIAGEQRIKLIEATRLA